MVFPAHLTEEEEMLQNKYAKIRKKKGILQQIKLNKNKPAPLTPQAGTKRSLPETSQEDAKEMAKKVLAAQQVKQAIQEEKRISSGFKRTRKPQRGLAEPEKVQALPSFQPFISPTSGPSSGEETLSPLPDSRRLHKKSLTESFVSSRTLSYCDSTEESPEKKRGNTVYVHGRGISHEFCDKTFRSFGTISNINMEQEKNCSFITFDDFDMADRAILEMDSKMVAGIRLHVSMARRQPGMYRKTGAGEPHPLDNTSHWKSLALGNIKGSRHRDKRAMSVYDDDLFG